MNVSVKNVGTTPLLATDSIRVGYFFYGDSVRLLKDESGNVIKSDFLGPLAVNETKSITPFNLTVTRSENGDANFCAMAIPFNRSADSVKDENLDNNIGCVDVKIASGGTAIHDITASQSKHRISEAYPKPCKGAVNFNVNMGERDKASIMITDMTGRTILTENKGMLSAGDHTLIVDAGHLPSGIYLYEVRIGEERNRGKISLNNN